MEPAKALATKVCSACGERYPPDALFCPSDGTPLQSGATGATQSDAHDPYLGREILGHIQVKQLAGIGAMGRVYRAFQTGIDRDVAVKILHRELSSNPQLVSRFTREAKVASRLQHPNVVQVLLAGQLPDGAMYIVMEFLDGLSLQSALAASSGVMPLSRAVHVGLQLCDAVGEAHSQGIVHRDLKPENVMLVRRGEDLDFVKVLDFGIARINWGGEQSMATAAGLIFGTARYISPEGAQGDGVNPPGDVYSIATLLFQMLAGRTPFEGDQAVGMLLQQIHDSPPHIKSIPRASYLPDPIADVIMANLVKSPQARMPDARSFGRALAEAARMSGLSVDEIGRPSLIGAGGQANGGMKLLSMERTRQLDLSPELQERMSPPPTAHRASGTEIAGAPAHSPSSAPGNETVRWAPPAPPVERTLDELSFPTPRITPGPPRAAPSHPPHLPPPSHSPHPPRSSYPSQPSEPSPSAPPVSRPSQPRSYSSPQQIVLNATLDDNDDVQPAPRAPSRSSLVALVIACFVLGALLAVGVGYQMGRIGPDRGLEKEISRAESALFSHRLYEPPGDNVREITAIGLQRWPANPRLLEIRRRACDDLVNLARVEKSVPEALRIAKIALDLAPTNPAANRLVEELEAELSSAPVPSTAPLAPAPKVAVAQAPVAGSKLTLDVTPPTPRVGQPVVFVSRVTPQSARVSDASFVVSGGPMGPPVRMITVAGPPGTFRGGFTFLEPGRYLVVFTAVVDGAAVHAERNVSTAGAPAVAPSATPPSPLPPSAPSAPSAPPQPSASSSRWL